MSRTAVSHAEVLAAAGRVRWLAELTICGAVFRVTDDDVDVTDAAGVTYTFVAGLQDLVHDTSIAGVSAASVTVGPDVAGELGGWPTLIARGGPPHGGRVRLIRWVEGQVLEEGRVLVDGTIVDAEYGDATEPLSVSVERATSVVQLVPPSSAVIDQRTWPSSPSYQTDEEILGAVYPLVFGRPGRTSQWGGLTLRAHSTPAYLADYATAVHAIASTKLVFAWVPDGTTLVDTTVSFIEVGDGRGASGGDEMSFTGGINMPVLYTTDLLGRKVAYVSPQPWSGWSGTLLFRPGSEYWARWENGGIYNEARTGAMRQAGEIIRYLLRLGEVPVAEGRMAAARGRLDRFLLDFALVQQVDPDAFVAGEIGRVLPLAKRMSADGVWYELLRYDAPPRDVVLHLVVPEHDEDGARYVDVVDEDTLGGPLAVVKRQGNVQWTPFDDVANEFTFRYAPTRGGTLTKRVVITGAATPDLDADEHGSAACAASRARFGKRVADPIDAPIIQDDATAVLAAMGIATRRAMPRRLIQFEGAVVDLEVLEPGDVVRITDLEVGFAGHLAIVTKLVVGYDVIRVSVEVLDTPYGTEAG